MKTCIKCKETKALTSEFWHRNKNYKDGFAVYCKVCNTASSMKSRRKLVLHPITGELVSAGYLSNTKSRPNKYGLERRHKLKGALTFKPQPVIRKLIGPDPLFQLAINLRALLRQSINRRNFGKKQSKTAELLGCTWEEFAIYLGPKRKGAELDHIIPCVAAQNILELLALQHYTNLQYLSSTANRQKAGKLEYGWELQLKELLELLHKRAKANELDLRPYFL